MSFFVAFYSYKGGVGRTLALANVAYSLAAHGKRVVLVDMDLEAPGLHDFSEFTLKGRGTKGFLEYAAAYREKGECPDIGPYVHRCRTSPGTGQLWLMPAGALGTGYQDRLGEISWRLLHPERGTEPFVARLRAALTEKIAPHYVLIDARTGLSDIGGLSTHLLADMVVLIFNLTRSSIEGSVRAYRSFTYTQVRFIQLVASPVPPLPPGSSLIADRLAQAVEHMPLGVAFGRTLIRLDYHPGMALSEELAVRHPEEFPTAVRYEALREGIQRANPEEIFPIEEEARALRSAGRLEEAITILRMFSENHPKDPDSYLVLGNFLFEAGQVLEAIAAFRSARELAPDVPAIHRRLGEALIIATQAGAAAQALQKAIALGERSPETYAALSKAHSLRAETTEASEARQKAVLAILAAAGSSHSSTTPIEQLREEFIELLGNQPPFPGFQPEEFWDAVMDSPSVPSKRQVLHSVLAGSIPPAEVSILRQLLDDEKTSLTSSAEGPINATAPPSRRQGISTLTFYVNGVDAFTGQRLQPWSTEHAAEVARTEYQSTETVAVSRSTRRALEADSADLAQAGWGVIFAAGDERTATLRRALRDLLDLRRSQATSFCSNFYHELSYRLGESKGSFLRRHQAGPGPADPNRVPYYLLIVGGPEAIPFSFQQQLGIEYAVGRLHFETEEEYEHYARSVIESETKPPPRQRHVTFFGTRHPGDPCSELTSGYLVSPLFSVLRGRESWKVKSVLGGEATKNRLATLLGGADTPDLLFTATHGVLFEPEYSEQSAHQGGLICQDWPGPRAGFVSAPHVFGAEDVGAEASISGLISFHYASFSAGTPERDDFMDARSAHSERRYYYTRRSFVAGLPQRLLGHPGGGALAVIGYAGLSIPCFDEWPERTRQLRAFEHALSVLMAGGPVGLAMGSFGRRYAELASDLAELQQMQREYGLRAEEEELALLWAASRDARNLVVLGDPAVRLAIQEDEAPSIFFHDTAPTG